MYMDNLNCHQLIFLNVHYCIWLGDFAHGYFKYMHTAYLPPTMSVSEFRLFWSPSISSCSPATTGASSSLWSSVLSVTVVWFESEYIYIYIYIYIAWQLKWISRVWPTSYSMQNISQWNVDIREKSSIGIFVYLRASLRASGNTVIAFL